MITFDITPIGKPRMTRSDRWRARSVVVNYWNFKDSINKLADEHQFILPARVNITFYIPMPPSWSKKKRDEMRCTPHQQTPDIDNLVKAVFDCLVENDSFVWQITAEKYWGDEGKIVFNDSTL